MKILKWLSFLESVGNKPVKDWYSYNNSLAHTLPDKLFFIDEVKFDVMVDFGGGDGSTINEIMKVKPNSFYILYDLDESQLEKARTILKGNVLITSDWSDVEYELKHYKNPLVNLSSVIHEVYSYSHPKDVKIFWQRIFSGLFNTITIRDMIPSSSIDKVNIKEYKEDASKIKKLSKKNIIDSFEDIWGSIHSNYRTMIHYLLKYDYEDNWDRELRENYVPITLETLKKKIPHNFTITFEDSFLLEYLKNEVKKKFGVDIKATTHTKMIIKKNINFGK